MPDDRNLDELDGFVARLTALADGDESAVDTYQEWAPRYESDLIAGYGYSAHRIAAQAFALHCPDRHASILDLGCGTGLVAQALRTQGFTCIDGLDASSEMLERAREKAIYRQLMVGDLTDTRAVAAGSYDAAIAVGVFGGGHVGPDQLPCFAHPVREGGLVALYANGIPFVEDDYRSHIERLAAADVWSVLDIVSSNYMDRIERTGYLVLARRGRGRTDG